MNGDSMAEETAPKKPKAKAKAKKATAPAKRGDIKIVIGAKSKPAAEPGVELWVLEGEEQTAKGDRSAVAYLTTQQLHALGWVRRKY